MDFFSQQERARRNTGRLIVLFGLAVLAMMAAVYAVLVVALHWDSEQPQTGWWNPEALALAAGGTLLVVGGGTAYRVAQLRAGGKVVARLMGAVPIQPNTDDPLEKTLVNIVEEMSVASGLPVPGIYVMEQESAINAFAAGYAPGDAIVAVTRGTLEQLSRDELQGVVAHEFSHILNGDMRLNIRLMGVLHGILCLALAGYMLLRGGFYSGGMRRRNSKGGGATALLALGVSLVVIGYVGVFFARLIQAAVSRQREFLADAAAVQYTRNPKGIAGALKRIGGFADGSRIQHPQAEAVSHMFFGAAMRSSLSGLFATHPPLPERIRRIDRDFDPSTAEPRSATRVHDVVSPATAGFAGHSAVAAAAPSAGEGQPDRLVRRVGAPTAEHLALTRQMLSDLPLDVAAALHEPFHARALVFALLLDPDPEVRKKQIELLEYRTDKQTLHEAMLLRDSAAGLERRQQLPVLDLLLPALRDMSSQQHDTFRRAVRALVEADQRVDLWEFTLQKVLMRHLSSHFDGPPTRRIRHHSVQAILPDCQVLLSALARVGTSDPAEVEDAFHAGMRLLPGDGYARPLLDRAACGLTPIDRALDRVAASSPGCKRMLLRAAAETVCHDGLVKPREAELMRAVADAIDCPMPPLVRQPSQGPA